MITNPDFSLFFPVITAPPLPKKSHFEKPRKSHKKTSVSFQWEAWKLKTLKYTYISHTPHTHVLSFD